MKIIYPAATLAMVTLLPMAAFGSPIYVSARGQANGAGWNSFGNGPQTCSYGYNSTIANGSCTYTSSGLINQFPFSGQANAYTGDVSSSADALTGDLHAYVSQTLTNYPIDPNISDGLPGSTLVTAQSDATMGDSFVLVAPPGGPPTIQVVFKMAVDGIFKSFDTIETAGYATLDYGGNCDFCTNGTFFDQASGGQIYLTPAVKGTVGAAFDYHFTLTAYSEIACGSVDHSRHLCSATQSSDFSDTAHIEQIIVEDLNGNQLNGYTATSQSGIDYNALLAGDTSAPEPGTWMLAGSALIVAIGLRRRVTG